MSNEINTYYVITDIKDYPFIVKSGLKAFAMHYDNLPPVLRLSVYNDYDVAYVNAIHYDYNLIVEIVVPAYMYYEPSATRQGKGVIYTFETTHIMASRIIPINSDGLIDYTMLDKLYRSMFPRKNDFAVFLSQLTGLSIDYLDNHADNIWHLLIKYNYLQTQDILDMLRDNCYPTISD